MVTRLMGRSGVVDADKSQPSSFKILCCCKRKDCKIEEVKELSFQSFDGSIAMMVSTLAKQEVLSEKKRLKSLKKL